MDKNNENNIPDTNIFDEAETKKNLVNARIRKAQIEAKHVEQKPQIVKKASKKKKNPAAPSPKARSPAGFSPVGNARKGIDEKNNEVGKYLKAPIPRTSQEPEKEKEKDNNGKNKKKKSITETEEEEISDRKYIKFIDQVAFVETGTTLNTYFLTHLLNVAQSLKSYEAFTRNTVKNRNPDVFCIDKTRVRLTDPTIEYYIHANHIKFEKLTKTYIATQHPLPSTLNDFWAMIADQKVDTIVSLTHSSSMINSINFPVYYPNKPETVRNFGQFFILCKTVNPPKTKYGCTEYKLEMVVRSEKEEKRSIRLFHYQHWVKNTVPASSKVVLDIVRKLSRKKSHGPIVIQCETGVNQSAEVIYVDAMCSMLGSGVEANFDTLLRQMKKQRAQIMTQRLHFLHSISTVLEYIKYRFKPVPSALYSQIESIQFSISKDFRYNMSIEVVDELNPMRSPTMVELINEDNAK